MPACTICSDSGWVCERHPDRPWDGDEACRCGAPCPACNTANDGEAPRMPSGFTSQFEKKD